MSFFAVNSLSKSYGEKSALKDVSFHIEKGEIVALIGKNGAGKTTLLNCIAGSITPDHGSVLYRGNTLLAPDSPLDEFGILIKAAFFEYLNAADNLALLMKASGFTDKAHITKTVDDTLKLVDLTDKKRAFVKSFSFGMKQRLGLAQALLHDPSFLILDEPFVGLDPIGKKILKDVILQKAHKEEAGILFSSHDLYDVSEICDRIIMLDKGQKVFDGHFRYARTYRIVCSALSGQVCGLLPDSAVIQNNTVELCDPALLQDTLEKLLQAGSRILDIRIHENSLYDYFEQEAAE